jgi:Family of unknown function (DUF5522)
MAPLVEGVDYYMEGDKFVFMAAYHLKRGYCCNSRCRHCPYGGEGIKQAAVVILGAPGKRSAGGT